MNYRYCILAALIIVPSNLAAQQWDNPENQMLSNTMNDFFYYATKDPVPFSDPQSLKNAEYHAAICDNYHEEIDRINEMVRQQSLLQEIQMRQRYRAYRSPYRTYNYNNGPGFNIPYP